MRPEIPRHLQVLTVPGLHGSGPGHWQSRWEQLFPDWQRVEQHDWSRPSLPLWAERVSEGVMRAQRVASRGAVLVAHSFGCLATLRQAALDPVGIAGALLVAPADPDKFGVAALLPAYRLPFPTLMVASRNDPWMPQRTAFSWGTLWGSEVVDGAAWGTSMPIPALASGLKASHCSTRWSSGSRRSVKVERKVKLRRAGRRVSKWRRPSPISKPSKKIQKDSFCL